MIIRSLRRVVLVAVGAFTTVAIVATPVAGSSAIGAAPSTTVQSSQPKSSQPKSSPEADSGLAAMERRVIELHNQARASAGLRPMQMHRIFVEASRDWSEEMAATNELRHQKGNPSYVDETCGRTDGWRTCAENVAVGFASAESVHDGWMNSEGHRTNIMRPGTNRMGVGVWRDSRGRLWWTARFMEGTTASTADPSRHPLDGSGWSSSPEDDAAVAAYVDATYRVFVGRRASDAERARWTDAFGRGVSRGEFIAELSTSDAWLGAEINAIYRTALGRSPDARGRRYWTETVRAGTRITELGIFVYSSDEFFDAAGGTDDAFVEAVHHKILGRAASNSQRAEHVGTLTQGGSRPSVVADVYATLESRLGRVDGLYGSILGRTADGGGRRYWAGELTRHDDVRLAAFLAGSDEFHRKSTAGTA